jgi:hypothetical protein
MDDNPEDGRAQQPVGIMWLVGRLILDEGCNEDVLPWEFMGLFTSSAEAEAACTDWNDFVASVEINKKAPEQRETFENSWYPVQNQWCEDDQKDGDDQ